MSIGVDYFTYPPEYHGKLWATFPSSCMLKMLLKIFQFGNKLTDELPKYSIGQLSCKSVVLVLVLKRKFGAFLPIISRKLSIAYLGLMKYEEHFQCLTDITYHQLVQKWLLWLVLEPVTSSFWSLGHYDPKFTTFICITRITGIECKCVLVLKRMC